MDTLELFERFSLALAVGLLIGLERGWQTRDEPEGERAAGVRTHALAALLGALWAAIAQRIEQGGIALGLAFLAFGGTIVLFRFREVVHEGTYGATTAVAGLVAFALGAYAMVGDLRAAAALGVAVAGLLALKTAAHAWIRRLSWPELRSILVILAMTFIALPVLPNGPVDPMGAVNPHQIWLLTVMIAAISFAGYVAIKLTGERRGVALTGLAGGLASSTATTLTLARVAHDQPAKTALLAAGAMIAGATMMLRVLAIVAVVDASLLRHLALPLLAAAATQAVAAAPRLLRDEGRLDALPESGRASTLLIANPLDLSAVLRFGALLTVIGILASAATAAAGNAGAFAVAALSGLADVDAVTLSMARLAGTGLSEGVAAAAIATAVGVNTVAKAVLGWTAGGRRFGTAMMMVALAAVAAGALALAMKPLLIGG